MARFRAIIAFALLLTWAGFAAARPDRLQVGRFLLVFGPAARAEAEHVAELVQPTLSGIERVLKQRFEGMITLRVFNRRRAFDRAIHARAEELILGEARTPSNEIYLDASGEFGSVLRILRHEVTHIVWGDALGDHGRALCTTWLNEGVAKYLEDPRPGGGAASQDAVSSGNTIPIEQLDQAFRRDETRSLAYAESESLVRFMVAQHGQGVLAKLIANLRAAPDFEDALTKSISATSQELYQAWHRQVYRPSRFTFLLESSTLIWMLMTVLLLITVALFYRRKWRRQRVQQELEEIEEQFSESEPPTIH